MVTLKQWFLRCTPEKPSERRNKALEYRKEMKQKNPIVQAYIKYPAILMVKKGTDNKYRTEKEF